MTRKATPCRCGSTEFVSQPNRYDVYALMAGKLEFQTSESIDSLIVLYCRECGKQYRKALDTYSETVVQEHP